MRPSYAPHLDNVIEPPIVEFKNKFDDIVSNKSKDALLDLTQAVPAYGPPQEIKQSLSGSALSDTPFFYTEDQGLKEVRTTIAEWYSRKGQMLEPDDIVITAGANMAFLMTMMVLLAPGDDVILPTPYYFNHEMAVRLCHGNPIQAPFSEDDGFSLDVQAIQKAITDKTRAIVLVSPNNPAGTLYSKTALEHTYEICRTHGIYVIHDETYDLFDSSEQRHYSLTTKPGWKDNCISIHSFSKSLSITGLRIGFVACNEQLLKQIMKVQDTMVICAPHICQLAVKTALLSSEAWMLHKRKEMYLKVSRFRNIFTEDCGHFHHVASGAFFGYVRHDFEDAAPIVALKLAEKAGILTLPGTFFGSGQESYLRLAFGNIEIDQFEQLAQGLADFTL